MTPDPPAAVSRLKRADWRVLRAARLEALEESPGAYTSTYAEEVGDGGDRWRRRFDGTDWLVARRHGRVIGLASLVRSAGDGGHRYIEAVWVAPDHRRCGVLRSLVRHLVEIGRRAQLEVLLLWVVGDNHDAWRAYRRLGFAPTGRVQPLGPGTGTVERQLELPVRR